MIHSAVDVLDKKLVRYYPEQVSGLDIYQITVDFLYLIVLIHQSGPIGAVEAAEAVNAADGRTALGQQEQILKMIIDRQV